MDVGRNDPTAESGRDCFLWVWRGWFGSTGRDRKYKGENLHDVKETTVWELNAGAVVAEEALDQLLRSGAWHLRVRAGRKKRGGGCGELRVEREARQSVRSLISESR